MKKIAMLLVMVLCLGCSEPKPEPNIHLDMNIGRIIEIDIEGRRYKVRVNTPNGTDDVWFRDTDVKVVVK